MLWKMLCICEHHPCFSVGHPWYTTHILRCHPQPWDNLHFRSHLCPQWEMEKYICWILLIAPHNRKWLTGGDQLSTQKFGFLCYRGHWPYRNLDFYASDLGQKVYKSCGWTQSFSCPATVQGVTPLPSMEESHNMYILHVHCTLYIVHCTLYIVHCTLYIVHCTLYM